MASIARVWIGASSLVSDRTARHDVSRRWLAAGERFLFAPANPRGVAMFRAVLAVVIAYAMWPSALRPRTSFLTRALADWSHAGLAAYWLGALVALCVFASGRGPRWLGFALLAISMPFDLVADQDQSRQVYWYTLLCLSFAWPRAPGSQTPVTVGDTTRSVPRLRVGLVSVGPIWPIRLIQIELSVVYGINALAKSTPAFLSGEVLLGLSKMQPNFLLDLSDGQVHLFGLSFPVWLAACATVATEYFLAIGFWIPRLRIVTAVVGVAFHLLLQQVIRIGLFDWASMMLYLAFLLPMEERRPQYTRIQAGLG